MKKIVLATIIMMGLTGCSQRLVDFTMISSKNIDFSHGAQFQRGTNRVTGEDSRSIIVFIPTGNPSIKEAMDRAIQSQPGAVGLVDGVVTYDFWWIPYIYGRTTYTVEGTPLIDPNLLNQSNVNIPLKLKTAP